MKRWLTPITLYATGVALVVVVAQTPPMPPAPRTVPIVWDRLPSEDYFRAVDTNGNPVHITFRVYQATNITGPWEVVAVTTNHQAEVSNLTARTYFFYVTSSNFFLESDRSEVIGLPYERVPGTRFIAK
jgi:hypothetical protein